MYIFDFAKFKDKVTFTSLKGFFKQLCDTFPCVIITNYHTQISFLCLKRGDCCSKICQDGYPQVILQ